MNITEAKDIVHKLVWKSNLTEDEEFMLIEAWGYLIESVDDEGGISISFDGRWFRSPGDLFRKAKIGDMLLTQLRDDISLKRVLPLR